MKLLSLKLLSCALPSVLTTTKRTERDVDCVCVRERERERVCLCVRVCYSISIVRAVRGCGESAPMSSVNSWLALLCSLSTNTSLLDIHPDAGFSWTGDAWGFKSSKRKKHKRAFGKGKGETTLSLFPTPPNPAYSNSAHPLSPGRSTLLAVYSSE